MLAATILNAPLAASLAATILNAALIARIPSLLCQLGVGRVLFYMLQRKFQLGRMVIVIVVTPLNLYKTEPGATFV